MASVRVASRLVSGWPRARPDTSEEHRMASNADSQGMPASPRPRPAPKLPAAPRPPG